MSLVDGLVSFWKLGEASGTRADSVDSNDLTDSGTVSSAVGVVGDCAVFDGTNYLSCAHNANLEASQFTLALWVYFDSAGDGTYLGIFGNGWTGSGVVSYRNTDGTLHINNGAGSLTTAGTVSSDTWHFIVYRNTGSQLSITVDNGTPETGSAGGATYTSNDFFLGSDIGATNLIGMMDAVGFWERSLDDSEVAVLWNGGLGREEFPSILECESSLTASGDAIVNAAAALECESSLNATAIMTGSAVATLQSVASLTANADNFANAAAALECVATLTGITQHCLLGNWGWRNFEALENGKFTTNSAVIEATNVIVIENIDDDGIGWSGNLAGLDGQVLTILDGPDFVARLLITSVDTSSPDYVVYTCTLLDSVTGSWVYDNLYTIQADCDPAALLKCVASLTASAAIYCNAAAALECVATLSAAAQKMNGGGSVLGCVASLTASSSIKRNAAAALECVASLTASPYVSVDCAATLHGVCTITANGETGSKSHLQAVATLTAAGQRVKNAAAHRSSLCTLNARGGFSIEGSSSLAAVCSLSANATATEINYIEEALFHLLSPLGNVSFAAVEQELLERLG